MEGQPIAQAAIPAGREGQRRRTIPVRDLWSEICRDLWSDGWTEPLSSGIRAVISMWFRVLEEVKNVWRMRSPFTPDSFNGSQFPITHKTKQPNGCFVSVCRKADYLRAISKLLPAFDGPLAT